MIGAFGAQRTLNLLPDERPQKMYVTIDSIETVQQDANGGIPFITTKSGKTYSAPRFDTASDLVIAIERASQ